MGFSSRPSLHTGPLHAHTQLVSKIRRRGFVESGGDDSDRTQLDAFVVGVEQEGAEAVGHVVVGQELQVVLAELELHGEL